MKNISPIQFQKYYHGSNAKPEVILKEGLKAHNPAEELWGGTEWEHDEGHPTGVYFFENKEDADEWGSHTYSVELPHPHKNWGWTESNGVVWTSDIPPHLIRDADNPNSH